MDIIETTLAKNDPNLLKYVRNEGLEKQVIDDIVNVLTQPGYFSFTTKPLFEASYLASSVPRYQVHFLSSPEARVEQCIILGKYNPLTKMINRGNVH